MGKPKSLLPWGESTVIETVVSTAKTLPHKSITIVSGSNHKQLKALLGWSNVELLYNSSWEKGMGSSLAMGVSALKKQGANAILVMLADMPTICLQHLRKLTEEFRKNTHEIVCSDYGNMSGVPAIFGASTFATLMNLDGDLGAKQILTKSNWNILKLACSFPFEDIDTPESYQKLKQKYRC